MMESGCWLAAHDDDDDDDGGGVAWLGNEKNVKVSR
jgi:hypothetical protein